VTYIAAKLLHPMNRLIMTE